MDLSEFLLSSKFLWIWFSNLRFRCPWLAACGTALPNQEVLSREKGASAPAGQACRGLWKYGDLGARFLVFFIMCYARRKHLLLKNKDKSPKVTEMSSAGALQICLEWGQQRKIGSALGRITAQRSSWKALETSRVSDYFVAAISS